MYGRSLLTGQGTVNMLDCTIERKTIDRDRCAEDIGIIECRQSSRSLASLRRVTMRARLRCSAAAKYRNNRRVQRAVLFERGGALRETDCRRGDAGLRLRARDDPAASGSSAELTGGGEALIGDCAHALSRSY